MTDSTMSLRGWQHYHEVEDLKLANPEPDLASLRPISETCIYPVSVLARHTGVDPESLVGLVRIHEFAGSTWIHGYEFVKAVQTVPVTGTAAKPF